MKNLIVTMLSAIMLTFSALASDTNSVPSLFNANELGVTLSTGYDVGSADEVNGQTLFSEPYNVNLTLGAFWYPWRNLGFEANIPVYNTEGVSVDEVQAGVLFRLPLSKSHSVLKHFAPYVGVGGVYNWQDVQNWAYVAKAGLEFRFNPKWGVFTEAQYRNYNFDPLGAGAISVQGGLKVVF